MAVYTSSAFPLPAISDTVLVFRRELMDERPNRQTVESLTG